jgi:hypothetical protein
MLNFEEKISYLEKVLNKTMENYADSFLPEIAIYFNEFNSDNPKLFFLKEINTHKEIDIWIKKLTSRIVMKEGGFQTNEIIDDYIEFG